MQLLWLEWEYLGNNYGIYRNMPFKLKLLRERSPWEHSRFVTIIIDVATGWLFEDGYAKEAAGIFQTA